MKQFSKEYTKEEQLAVYEGIAADGTISEEAEAIIREAIDEAKSLEAPVWEVKRRLRSKIPGDKGIVVAAAVAKLW